MTAPSTHYAKSGDVHIAYQVTGEVSQTLKDLVAGSGISFESRGTQILKGVPGEWQLCAVSSA